MSSAIYAGKGAGNGKITVPDILRRKTGTSSNSNQDRGRDSERRKIVCLTAYDYPTARLVDEAGVDVVLVGDSLGMVVLGYENTLPLTIEEMLHHTRAVRRGVQKALLVADMPYGSFHGDKNEAVRNAVRFVKEAGAEAVKVEGGERRMDLIAQIVEAEIPVMAHIGLTPQSTHAFGGFRVQGKTVDAAEQIIRDARAVEAALEIRRREAVDVGEQLVLKLPPASAQAGEIGILIGARDRGVRMAVEALEPEPLRSQDMRQRVAH